MAEYEAKKTSKRIKFNNKMRIKNKQVVTSSFIFPWIVAGEQRNRHLIQNTEKAHILMDLLEFFETHQSKRATAIYINTKYGMNLSLTTMTNLLTDTLLFGEYKGIPDYVEPYITKERFDHIQEILKRNARYSTNKPQVFLYSGILKCPSCGCNLVGNYKKPRSKGGKGTHFYRCNTYRASKKCTYTFCTSEPKIERQLLENLGSYINNEIVKVESLSEIAKPQTDNSKKIDALKKEMERLNMMFRKGRISEEEYDSDYMELERELKRIDVVEKPEVKNLDHLKALLETDYKGLYAELDRQHKKAFWRNLIKEFKLDENKKVIPESIIFF
jgi:hypothetical protein